MDQDKSSLIKQRPIVEAKENKIFLLYFTTLCLSAHFMGSRASVPVTVAPEDKCCNNKCPTFFFLLAFITKQKAYGMEYPFGHFELAVLSMTAPKNSPTSSLVAFGGDESRMLERQP